MSSRCAFGGRRVSVLGSDGRIVVKEKDVKDDIATFEPCGATSITMSGTFFKEECNLLLGISDTGDFLAAGTESGAVMIWNVLSHQQEILSSSISSPVTSVSFIGSCLYSSQSGKILKWENGQIKDTFKFDKKVKITKLTKGPNSTIIGTG